MNTINNMDTQFDVFISYSHYDYIDENKEVIPNNPVSAIMKLLQDNHLTFWIDEKGIYHGDAFIELLAENIEKSKIILFLSSVNSNASDWTSKEISAATQWKKKIIPVRLDDTPYNKKVMLQISDLDYVEYYKNPAVAEKSLIRSILKYKEELEAKRAKEEQKRLKQEKEKKEQEQAAKRKQEQEELSREINRAIQAIKLTEDALENKRTEQKKQIESVDSKSKQKELLLELEQSNQVAFNERAQCRVLLEQIESLNKQINLLKQEVDKTIKMKLKSGEYVAREEVEQLKRDAVSLVEKNAKSAHSERVKSYQAEIDDLTKVCAKYEANITNLKTSLTNISIEKDKLSKEKIQLKAKCDSLSTNVDSLNESHKILRQEHSVLIKEKNELLQRISSLEEAATQQKAGKSKSDDKYFFLLICFFLGVVLYNVVTPWFIHSIWYKLSVVLTVLSIYFTFKAFSDNVSDKVSAIFGFSAVLAILISTCVTSFGLSRIKSYNEPQEVSSSMSIDDDEIVAEIVAEEIDPEETTSGFSIAE